MLLAKLTQPELVGQFALGFAIAAPVFSLAGLQLRLALVSDIREETHFGHYLSLRLFTTAFGLLIIFATSQVLGFHGQVRWVILLVGVAQGIEAVSDIYYGRLQLHDRMVWIAKSMIGRTMLSALGLVAGVYLTGSLLWGVAGIVAARTVVLLGYDMRERTHDLPCHAGIFFRNQSLKPRWSFIVQRQMLRFSLPLSIIAVLVSLNFTIPRYFVGHALGERALGIFSAMAFVLAAGSLAVVSLGQSAFTRLARHYAAQDLTEFCSLLAKLLAMGAALGVCGVVVAKVAGRELLSLLFRPEYAERADLLPWVMAVGCVAYVAQFLGYGMTAAKFYHSQIVLFILTNVGVAAGCYLLIPRQGLLGAIFAMLLATFMQLVGSVIILVNGMRKHAERAPNITTGVPANVWAAGQ